MTASHSTTATRPLRCKAFPFTGKRAQGLIIRLTTRRGILPLPQGVPRAQGAQGARGGPERDATRRGRWQSGRKAQYRAGGAPKGRAPEYTYSEISEAIKRAAMCSPVIYSRPKGGTSRHFRHTKKADGDTSRDLRGYKKRAARPPGDSPPRWSGRLISGTDSTSPDFPDYLRTCSGLLRDYSRNYPRTTSDCPKVVLRFPQGSMNAAPALAARIGATVAGQAPPGCSSCGLRQDRRGEPDGRTLGVKAREYRPACGVHCLASASQDRPHLCGTMPDVSQGGFICPSARTFQFLLYPLTWR